MNLKFLGIVFISIGWSYLPASSDVPNPVLSPVPVVRNVCGLDIPLLNAGWVWTNEWKMRNEIPRKNWYSYCLPSSICYKQSKQFATKCIADMNKNIDIENFRKLQLT